MRPPVARIVRFDLHRENSSDFYTTKAQRGKAATKFRNISRKGAKAQRFEEKNFFF
jgi:hypothetical protein